MEVENNFRGMKSQSFRRHHRHNSDVDKENGLRYVRLLQTGELFKLSFIRKHYLGNKLYRNNIKNIYFFTTEVPILIIFPNFLPKVIYRFIDFLMYNSSCLS